MKIDDEAFETGSTCEAHWEDAQTKGWFEAIILAFGGKSAQPSSLELANYTIAKP